jgi:porphobilinogen deaminase
VDRVKGNIKTSIEQLKEEEFNAVYLVYATILHNA